MIRPHKNAKNHPLGKCAFNLYFEFLIRFVSSADMQGDRFMTFTATSLQGMRHGDVVVFQDKTDLIHNVTALASDSLNGSKTETVQMMLH